MKRTRSLAALFSGAAASAAIQAGVVLSPVSATPNSPTVGSSPTYMIDGSGLSVPFNSGVTNFSAYLASNPTYAVHGTAASQSTWSGAPGDEYIEPGSRYIDFDLGASIETGRLFIATGPTPYGLIAFTLFGSDRPDFLGMTDLGTFSVEVLAVNIYSVIRRSDGKQLYKYGYDQPVEWVGFEFDTHDHVFEGSQGNILQAFDFTDITARYFRIQANSNTQLGFKLAEVAFEAGPAEGIPEPSTVLLTAVAGLAMTTARRRRLLQLNR